MKTSTAFAFFILAVSALAAECWMDPATRQVSWFRPASVTIGKVTYSQPTDEMLAKRYVVVEYDDCEFKHRIVKWDGTPTVTAMTQKEKDALAEAEKAQADAAQAAWLAEVEKIAEKNTARMDAEKAAAKIADKDVREFAEKLLKSLEESP